MLFKIKKDLRSTKLKGNRSATPPSFWALKKKNNTRQSGDQFIGKGILTSQSLKNPTTVNINTQLECNFARDNQLTHGPPPLKRSENQNINQNIYWRPTTEISRGASEDRGGVLRKRFCHCLCEERKYRSNGKSSELHVVNLISEMGFFRWCFCPFSPSYLYLVRNTFISYADIRV